MVNVVPKFRRTQLVLYLREGPQIYQFLTVMCQPQKIKLLLLLLSLLLLLLLSLFPTVRKTHKYAMFTTGSNLA